MLGGSRSKVVPCASSLVIRGHCEGERTGRNEIHACFNALSGAVGSRDDVPNRGAARRRHTEGYVPSRLQCKVAGHLRR